MIRCGSSEASCSGALYKLPFSIFSEAAGAKRSRAAPESEQDTANLSRCRDHSHSRGAPSAARGFGLNCLARGGQRTDRPALRAFIRRPYPHEITLGDHMPDRLPGVWKDRRILVQKFLQLIQATDFDSGRRLAMTYDIARQ